MAVEDNATMETKHITVPLTLKAGDESGAVQSVFSVFGVIDDDGDVVVAGAIPDGQTVPMSAWGHNWGSLPVGKGMITTDAGRALFDGAFFMDTTHGRDTYLTVKGMGSTQEWSWGFRILEAENGQIDGRAVRFIKRTEVYEVSPVMVGANRETFTLAIKGQTLTYADHAEAVLAAVEAFGARTTALAALRAKEGRSISTQRRGRLSQHPPVLRSVADDLDALLTETAPPEKDEDGKAALRRELGRFLAFQASRNGVALG